MGGINHPSRKSQFISETIHLKRNSLWRKLLNLPNYISYTFEPLCVEGTDDHILFWFFSPLFLAHLTQRVM